MADEENSNTEDYKYSFIDALLGAINEAPVQVHGRILRSYLLDAIDKMQEHSVFQLDLLEKIALIALNNVEARIKEFNQGPPATFGAIVGELFFSIAIEAAMVAGIAYIGPAVATTVATSLVFVLTNAKTTTRAQKVLRRSLSKAEAAKELEERLLDLASEEGRILERLFNKPPSRNKRQRRQYRKDRKIQRAELHAIQNEINFSNRLIGFCGETRLFLAVGHFPAVHRWSECG